MTAAMGTSESDLFCLAIEASNPGVHAEVGVGRIMESGVDVLGIEPIRPVGRNEDDLLPAIDRVCRSAGVQPGSLRLVGVSVGPGGYTSLRVACAAGKMIAAASGGKCVPIPTALGIVTHMRARFADARVGVFLAGKDDSAHLTIFPRGGWTRGTPLPQGALVTVSTLPLEQVDIALGDRYVPAPLRDALTNANVPLVEPSLSAAACLGLMAKLDAVDPVELVPIYPREPDAVTLWRQRKAK